MPDEVTSQTLTLLLRRWSEGDASALDEITPLVYHQLRMLADGYLRRERPDHTLQPTALVHEAYLRLVDQNQTFETRQQFYGVAAHLMRIILVDHARAHRTAKRGSGAQKVPLEHVELFSEDRGVDLLALDEVLDRLSVFDERKGRAIELRYFAGMSVEETADVLDISVATLRRELRFAENWLCRHLTKK
jgi:RNA polymerase sigma-70 factor (ECF subfamily)